VSDCLSQEVVVSDCLSHEVVLALNHWNGSGFVLSDKLDISAENGNGVASVEQMTNGTNVRLLGRLVVQ
jgi:hypothetical protein